MNTTEQPAVLAATARPRRKGRLTTTIDVKMLAKLRRYSVKTGRSVSSIIEEIIIIGTKDKPTPSAE